MNPKKVHQLFLLQQVIVINFLNGFLMVFVSTINKMFNANKQVIYDDGNSIELFLIIY